MMNIALYGDPAFKLFVPTSPQQPLLKVILDGDTAEVTGPGHWTKFKADVHMADEWNWDGDLYYYGAVGALAQRQWVARYDREWKYYYVRIKTDKFVHDVLPVTPCQQARATSQLPCRCGVSFPGLQATSGGFCCGWNSGCGRPSCVLGCHIATESADVTVCQETCRSLHDGQGCFPTVAGRWANVCSSCQGSCSV